MGCLDILWHDLPNANDPIEVFVTIICPLCHPIPLISLPATFRSQNDTSSVVRNREHPSGYGHLAAVYPIQCPELPSWTGRRRLLSR
jgi:hypothetical protein